ncbi:5-bromo-4-chloroindolyl phosphate hydrolysis family protein [uncultured Lactococcus sp.]|uniref:5-bromo-4-chloroindolyl phosphate hydrolysis family protein n=1 Tax=uncultured Lactococcus sp. TaxID=167973 RepID=UPI0027DCC6DD|nr:5-bromo-4-chloroindolyl phosphate hydrolysis family protein [uncultured Lactococcus sp.]
MYYGILLIVLIVAVLMILCSRFLKKLILKKAQIEKVRTFKKMYELNDEELKVFETVMREAKNDILRIVELTEQSDLSKHKKLQKAIRASQSIFKNLMTNPKDLIQYGDFLYKLLPGLVVACEEYNDIVESDIDSDFLNEKKSEILYAIEEFSQSIIRYWDKNVERDLNKVKIAKQSLEQKGLSI